MGRQCVVPYCNSGYSSNKEKVITFKFPSDPVRLEVWARTIPRKDRELTPHDYVCEKHFSESDWRGGGITSSVRKKRKETQPVVTCAKHAKTETSVV
ncbi:hypothetical protein HPB48_013718 [Haemaphysalis longicornis]|uniref:THAP-type domain-containing protein n=1 Tax=Haemaphysalis longicornis TaxID=44386 RepID=A0A9J6G7S1_HAELO|nr:hypothetical protein HPB48_013718 [Haemaphysalis longicornis]